MDDPVSPEVSRDRRAYPSVVPLRLANCAPRGMIAILAAPNTIASCTAAIAPASDFMVVDMDQYAALSEAVATRYPVETSFWFRFN